ncbi:MAG: hypothetical protein J6Z35_08305, partial [Lachnospiraceae bacterium]|nr:hypothetical protein [Lachnospiraceae bacterium]
MAEFLSKIVPVFLRVMQMSFSAGIVILLVALIRPFVGRASKRLGFWLWALVALRLILPAFPVSRLSLVKGTEFTAAVEYLETKREEQNTALPGPTEQEGGSQETESAPPAENTDAAVLGIPMTVLAGIWMAGIGGMTVYLAISLLRTGKKVSGAAHFRDNLYFCSETESAFIFGLLRPKVIIPAFTEETQLPFIEEHEKTHIRRLDHIWKALGFVLLMLHWMNPLVWIAYMLFARDMELACDEDMIREKDPSYRKEYAEVLILYSTKKRMSASAMPGFGGKMTKRRINCIMKYKKPAPLALILAVLLCLTACGGAITDQGRTTEARTEEDVVLTPQQRLEAFTEEQCIAFLREKGIEEPKESSENWRQFFYAQFKKVVENPDYIPVYGRTDLMAYSIRIRDAVLKETGLSGSPESEEMAKA